MKFGELVVTVVAGLGQLVGIRAGTEQPRYTVVEQVGAVEIRHYGPRLAAEAVVSGEAEAARNEGFRKVAGYIFGDNTAKASISMTAPVVQAGASQTISMTAPVVQTASFTVDLAAKRVVRDGAAVRLTPTEWHVLEILVRNAGKLVSQQHLLREVWGPHYEHETNYLRVYLAQLRRKLEPEPAHPRHLITEPGMGYRFEP